MGRILCSGPVGDWRRLWGRSGRVVNPPTAGKLAIGSTGDVGALNVAVVSRDSSIRLQAARAFDSAPPEWTVALHHAPPADADVVVAGADMDVEADVVFDPACPGRVLDDVSRAVDRTQETRIIAVTSPSGGTGVTTVALHLARESARSAPTCLVDFDLEWGAGCRLGLPADAPTWAEAGDSEASLLRAALPVPGGFRVLAGPEGTGPPDVGVLLRAARAHFGRIVVDIGRASEVPDLLESANAVVLVLSPSAPSARRARIVLDGLTSGRVAIITNRVGPGGEMTKAGIESIIGRKVALELPCDRRLRDAEDDDRLLAARWSRWERGIHRLWRTIESA